MSSGFGGYLALYAAFGCLVVAAAAARQLLACLGGIRAAESLHRAALEAVLASPLSWFEANPSGRVAQRFSKDVEAADYSLPDCANALADCLLALAGALLVVSATTPTWLLALAPTAKAYLWLSARYAASAAELKRLDSLSRSPCFTLLSETLDGAAALRSLGPGMPARALREHVARVEQNLRARLAWDALNRWLGVRLESLGAAAVLCATSMAVGWAWANGVAGAGCAERQRSMTRSHFRLALMTPPDWPRSPGCAQGPQARRRVAPLARRRRRRPLRHVRPHHLSDLKF